MTKKRRHSIRYPVELAAVLLVDRFEPIHCKILDFCDGGFFLELDPAYSELATQQAISIRFSEGENEPSLTFEVKGHIVHASSHGVGLSVDDMPPVAIRELTKYAQQSFKAAFDENVSDPAIKVDNAKAKQLFKRFFLDKLPILIRGYFSDLPEEFGILNQSSAYFANQSLLDDLMTTFKQNEEYFISEFCYAVIDELPDIAKSKEYNADFQSSQEALALVDNDVFEDWLNMKAIIRELNNRYEDKINQLTKEFIRVFGCPVTVDNNPVSPAVLFESFRKLVLQLELSNKINFGIYKCFEASLIGHLDVFYDETLSVAKAFASAKKNASNIPTNFTRENESKVYHVADGLKDFQSSTSASDSIATDYKPRRGPDDAAQRKPLLISELTERLFDILNNADTNLPSDPREEYYQKSRKNIEESEVLYSASEIANAMAKLQSQTRIDNSVKLDASSIIKQLEDVLEKSSVEKKCLPTESVRKIETYDRFFDVLENKFKSSSDLKSYLDKIQLPLLSLPLQGIDFLDLDAHPVSKILNQLAVLESAVSTNKIIKNLSVKSTVENLINRLSREANTNPDTLTEVAEELENLSSQMNKHVNLTVKRIIEPYEGRQKLEIAKRAVKERLNQQVYGQQVPKIIPELLEAGWQDLLIISELNKDKEDNTEKYWTVIDDLMFWLFQQDSILKIQIGSIYRTLEFISDSLRSVCTDIVQRNNINEELTALLIGTGSPKIRKRPKTIAIEAEKVPDDSSTSPDDDKWKLLADQLAVGDWLTISNGSLNAIPMKLIWVGNILQLYVFVDRDGLNKLEFSKTELTDYLRKGLAVKCENLDQPLMERATNSMLEGVHNKLVFNATHDPVTNLYNQDEFVRLLKNEIPNLENTQHVLCRIDLIDMRLITNMCGIAGSDQLLKDISQRISAKVTENELLARLGDKSFAILFKNCSVEAGRDKSNQVLKLINDSHFQWQDKSFAINVCIGLACMGPECFDVYRLLQQADFASISAERAGQNSILVFKDDDEALSQQNKLNEWIGLIDNIFAQNRLFVRCQMIAPIEMADNSHRHYEILLGIVGESGEIIPPDNFIPAVERCRRMPEIDQWII